MDTTTRPTAVALMSRLRLTHRLRKSTSMEFRSAERLNRWLYRVGRSLFGWHALSEAVGVDVAHRTTRHHALPCGPHLFNQTQRATPLFVAIVLTFVPFVFQQVTTAADFPQIYGPQRRSRVLRA